MNDRFPGIWLKNGAKLGIKATPGFDSTNLLYL